MYARRIHPSRFPDYRYQGKTPRPDLSFGSTSSFTPLKAFSSDSSLGILGACSPRATGRRTRVGVRPRNLPHADPHPPRVGSRTTVGMTESVISVWCAGRREEDGRRRGERCDTHTVRLNVGLGSPVTPTTTTMASPSSTTWFPAGRSPLLRQIPPPFWSILVHRTIHMGAEDSRIHTPRPRTALHRTDLPRYSPHSRRGGHHLPLGMCLGVTCA